MSESNKQCASCPFRNFNTDEFHAVVKKLALANGAPEPEFFACEQARTNVVEEAVAKRELYCHQAYDDDMKIDHSKRRPCEGLRAYLEDGAELPTLFNQTI